MGDRWSRRAFLGSVAASLTLGAGCGEISGGSGTGTGDETRRDVAGTETEVRTASETAANTETATETRTTEAESATGRLLSDFSGVDSGGALFGLVPDGERAVGAGRSGEDAILTAIDGQSLEPEWTRRYDWAPGVGMSRDAISVTRSGASGFSIGLARRDDPAVVVSTDGDGAVEWRRELDESDDAIAAWLVEHGDGSYVTAWTETSPHDSRTTVARFDGPGEEATWRQTFDVRLRAASRTGDGGCRFVGMGHPGKLRFWKVAADGTMTWEHATGYDRVRPYAGGYLLWNTRYEDGSPVGFAVQSLDRNREERWKAAFERPARGPDVAVPSEEGHLLVHEGEGRLTIGSLDGDGRRLGRTAYEVPVAATASPTDAVRVGDRLVVAGDSGGADPAGDGWLASIDPA